MHKLDDQHFHDHILKRINERGVSRQEVETTINLGKKCDKAKEGCEGKTFVFDYNSYRGKNYYKFKEVTIFYKTAGDTIVLLTVLARYGNNF